MKRRFLSVLPRENITLIKALCQKLIVEKFDNSQRKKIFLRDILTERIEYNSFNYPVHSVSVSKGVVNQIDYLGRSFAAKNISNYNVADFGDIIYTKSPTGLFPYGIIKQSFINKKVALSPLYGVFTPKSLDIGTILHYHFNNPINANNYLHPLIQKGAKNTINITNQRFLENEVWLPTDEKEIKTIASLLKIIVSKIELETTLLSKLIKQKGFMLEKLFI